MTDEMRRMLRARYPQPRYAIFEEVRNGAGFQATRSCDAIVMALWPSEGLTLTGIEVKASRADWLRELRQPEKADEFIAMCDFWYVATEERDIVKPEELPPKWGLLVPRGNSLIAARHGPQLTPLPLDRGMLASILKRAQESSATAADLENARAAGYKAGKKDSDYSAGLELSRLQKLERAVKSFQDASGLNISASQYDWNQAGVSRMGEAVRLLMNEGVEMGRYGARVQMLAEELEKAAGTMRSAAKEIRALEHPDLVTPA